MGWGKSFAPLISFAAQKVQIRVNWAHRRNIFSLSPQLTHKLSAWLRIRSRGPPPPLWPPRHGAASPPSCYAAAPRRCHSGLRARLPPPRLVVMSSPPCSRTCRRLPAPARAAATRHGGAARRALVGATRWRRPWLLSGRRKNKMPCDADVWARASRKREKDKRKRKVCVGKIEGVNICFASKFTLGNQTQQRLISLNKCDRIVTVLSLMLLRIWKDVSAFTRLQVMKLLCVSTKG